MAKKHGSMAAVLLAALLAGCGETSPVAVLGAPPSVTQISTLPVENTGAEFAEWARSVARIELAEGSSGSGFFISPKIILTNHHVVSRERCTTQSCQGVVAIRGFFPGGENQVFYRLKPLAHNKTLDFMLLEVQDGTAPIPGLPLASNAELASLQLEKLAVLGHPMGSPQKMSPARGVVDEDGQMQFDSAIFHGNSGGPLLHTGTGKVIGLVSRVAHDIGAYELGSKAIPFHAQALSSSALVTAIHRDYPSSRGTCVWKPANFNTPLSLTRVFSLFAQAPRLSEGLFFATKQSNDGESILLLSDLIERFERAPDTKTELKNFLAQTVAFDLRRGTKTQVPEKLLARIEALLPDNKTALRFLNYHRENAQLPCAEKMVETAGSLQEMGYLCHQTKMPSPHRGYPLDTDILALLYSSLASLRPNQWNDSLSRATFEIIKDQLLLRKTLTSDLISYVGVLLQRLKPTLKNGYYRAQLESFEILWATKPELLFHGGMEASFP